MSSWKDNIRKVTPYTPGEQPKISDVIKLNTNECPYPPSPLVTEMIEKMDTERFRLYPDPEASLLVNELAEYYNVKPEQVFVGVGSDDVLGMAFLTCFNSEKPILFPDITYSFYDVWAELFKIPYKTVALDEQFKINPLDFNKENGGIIFPNPNAPTAIEMPLEQVEEVIKNNPDVVVIVDEAYVDFGGHTALSLIDKYDNLLVVRTFSKSRAMAGMRIGYAFGSKELIDAIKAVKFSYNSYTMNQATIETGVAAIKDDTYFKNTVSKIIETRENAKKELKKLGFSFTYSKTNFIFATHKRMPAKEIFEKLKKKIYAHITKYNNTNFNDCFTSDYPDEKMEEKWLVNRTEYPFEGYNFKGFRDYDEYLSSLYGDYMTLPPENERETHTNAKVDYGQYDKWFEE